MSCIPSTYNASGELVGCTEQELHSIISTQIYTLFALGTGLWIYKTLTTDNWTDVAVQIGWGCVSAFTHAKRFTFRHVIPLIAKCVERDPKSDGNVENKDEGHCYVRVVKDGVELHSCSSIFSLIQHLTEHVEQQQQQPQQQGEEEDSDDVIDVQDPHAQMQTHDKLDANDVSESESESESEPSSHADDDEDADEDADEDEDDDAGNEFIADELAQIENHTMKFDFVMCQVPTMQTAASDTPMCMHVIKYDGFPRDSDGSYFFFRKFAPVNHRMMEIVLQCAGSEYELNLSSPDNFYVVGNNLLDPAFLKWFVRKNHGVDIDVTSGAYTIKCIDNNAEMQTLHPCNYLRVSESGFEIHDAGLI